MKKRSCSFLIGRIFFYSFLGILCYSFLKSAIKTYFTPFGNSGVLRNEAILEAEKGNYQKAESLYRQALDSADQGNVDAEHYALMLKELAGVYKDQGDFQKADSVYQKVLRIWKWYPGEQSTRYAEALNDLGLLYLEMGDLRKAEPLLRRALKIQEKKRGKQHPELATPLHNLGLLYLSLGQVYQDMSYFQKADSVYQKVLLITKKDSGEQSPEYAMALDNLGVMYTLHMGHYLKAEPLLRQALQIKERKLGKQHPSYALSLNNLGVNYLVMAMLNQDLSYLQKADSLFRQVLQILEKKLGRQHRQYAAALSNVGLMYFINGDCQNAGLYLQEANHNLLHQIRTYFPMLSEEEKTAFYENTIKVHFEFFPSLVLGCQEQNPELTAQLYNSLLVTKGLLFHSQNKIRHTIMESGDATLIGLYHQWQQKRDYLANVYQMSLQQKQQKDIDQQQLEADINKLERQLSAKPAAFARAADTTQFTWQDVQKQLKSGEAAVEVVRFRWFNLDSIGTGSIGYAALVVTPSTPLPVLILLSRGDDWEKENINYYQHVVKAKELLPADIPGRGQGKGPSANQLDHAQKLYQQFWQPIARHPVLQGVKRLYFSADGVYHQLNLNTLYNPKTKRYLYHELDIRLVTSTRDLLQSHKAAPTQLTATLIGSPAYDKQANQQSISKPASLALRDIEPSLTRDRPVNSLPGTRKEVRSIAQLLKQRGYRVDTWLGSQALEASIKRLHNPAILHIATHGFFQPPKRKSPFVSPGMESLISAENPLFRSGLLLTDGVLTAYEAMNLNLDQTGLVVLSACETGLGDISPGEGVYGLQRAFQMAGAKAVLMSLWKVDDAVAQQLMSSFYKHWLQTGNKHALGDKHAALAAAQAELRRDYPQPYYWGAFVLVGE